MSPERDDTGPPVRPGFRFGRALRLTRRADFERAMKEGRRSVDATLTVWIFPNGLQHPRLGLVVGRKHGDAVRRNRLKRVLREAFRLSQHGLPPGYDLVCAPRAGAKLTLTACTASLVRLATQLARRCAGR